MKREINELQAPLESRVPASLGGELENPSLQQKLKDEYALPEYTELQVQANQNEAIARLRNGLRLPDIGGVELLH